MKKRLSSVIAVLLSVILVISSFAFVPSLQEAKVAKLYESSAESKDSLSTPSALALSSYGIGSDHGDEFIVELNGEKVDLLSLVGLFKILRVANSFNGVIKIVAAYLNAVIDVLSDVLYDILPEVRHPEYVDEYESENFYAGTEEFIDEADSDAGWSLGYDRQLITPEDFGEKTYYKGGSGDLTIGVPLTGKYDDLYVRTTCIDAGEGTVVFAVIDSVGISNADVRRIRAAVEEAFADTENNIISVNVSTTHTHSGIDLQGLWAYVGTWKDNFSKTLFDAVLNGLDSIVGVDQEYFNFVLNQTVTSVENAYSNKTSGELYFTYKSTLNENGVSDYFRYRGNPVNLIDEIYRFRFVPDNGTTPTIIANFGVHPECIGVTKDTTMSADFIPYMERVVNDGGYNFIFIQGAIGEMITQSRGLSGDGVTEARIDDCRRYGEELGYVVLGMSYDDEQGCRDNVVNWTREAADLQKLEELNEARVAGGGEAVEYTYWYEDWDGPDMEEEAVEPILNIAIEEIVFKVDHPIANLLGKVRFTTNKLLLDKNDDEALYTITEVGYMEIGDKVKVFMSPGETSPELILGGKTMEAETSMHHEDFCYEPLEEYICAGEDNENILLVFDTMNDSAGYIMPDNDYDIIVVKYLDGEFIFHTTAMLVSLAPYAASTFIGTFRDLVTANS